MTSELKVDKITPASGTNTQIGESGDTITIPSGATIANSGTATGFGLSGWSSNSNNLLPASASSGIYLGVNSATASNLLNDYEFGTFTPDADPTNNSFSAKGTMTGFYTKIGNLVHFQVSIGVTTNGSASGNIEVYNLPFTTAATGLIHTINRGRETESSGTAFDTIQSRNTTTLVMLGPPFGNGSVYCINGTYRV
jgi:hypothetical protein